jgi:predicted Zn-dependent peptidase
LTDLALPPAARLHVLPNGVRVAFDPMPGLATVSLGVWLKTGAGFETPEENGVAHLLEHLVFKGAGGRGARALAEDAEARGIYLNAATGYERTGYHARCLREDADFALSLLADLTLAPHLDPADHELEKAVVMQEIGEAFDDPEDRCGVLHQGVAFSGHALGRPILGEPEALMALAPHHVAAFRARTCTPGAMIVAAAGAVDPDALLDRIRARFGDLSPAPAGERPPAPTGGGVAGERRRSEQAHLTFSLPACGQGDATAPAMRLLAEILGGGMASRLFQDLRETLGLVYAVEAFCDLYADQGRLCVTAGCAPGKASEVARRVAGHLQALADLGPGEVEMARARRVMIAALMMGAESPAARAEAAVGQIAVFGAPLSLDEIARRIRAVTADDVRDAARAALAGGRAGKAAASAVGPKPGLAAGDVFTNSF